LIRLAFAIDVISAQFRVNLIYTNEATD